jgi:shikimate dehydrogenase
MHAAANRELGLPHGYSAIDVPSEASLRRLVGEIRRGAFHGANITLPYKRAVLDMVDEIDTSASEVGAANVLCRTSGGRVVAHNTDAAALAADLTALFAAPAPGAPLVGRGSMRAVIIGAGGAGLAAVIACRRLGYKVIGVTTRSWRGSEAVYEAESAQRARAMGALATPWPTDVAQQPPSGKASQVLRLQWSEFAAAADLIIQATSAGMLGGDPGDDIVQIVPWKTMPAHAVAYDVVYNPPVTPFLREAQARGMRAAGGLGMLVRQAVRSFELWTGATPPVEPMRAAAEQILAGPLTPE